MHKSTGNMISADEAIERMGADIVRWLFSEQVPSQNINFGHGPADDVKRRSSDAWNSVSFLVTYANIEEFRPRYLEAPTAGRPLDRWLVARTNALLAAMEAAYERFWTPSVVEEFESFVDDVSNWYIRRSRKRFYSFDEAAFQTLWWASAGAPRDLADHAVPRRAPLASAGRAGWGAGVRLPAGWPEIEQPTSRCSRRSPRFAASSSSPPGASRIGPEAPPALRRLIVHGAALSDEHAAEVREELRVKEVEQGDVEAEELVVKPNLPVLGPRAGEGAGRNRSALSAGEYEQTDGGFMSPGTSSGPRTCSSSAVGKKAGRWPRTEVSPSRWTRGSTTSWCSKAACSTSSTS